MAYTSVCRALPIAALIAFAALTTAAPVRAQSLLFTLSGVTFNDGATGSGSFVYNQTTKVVSSINITTTNGNTGLTGANYVPGFSKGVFLSPALYQFSNGIGNSLNLVLPSAPLSPGTYALSPGTVSPQGSLNGSGEFARSSTGGSAPRTLSAGNLIATNVAPEPGSITLLLTAGIPVAAFMCRCKNH